MEIIIQEYEDTLIERLSNVGSHNFFFGEPEEDFQKRLPDPGGSNEKKALMCIRHCIEEILHWDVKTAVGQFDQYIIETMKLSRFVAMIKWPAEVDYGDPRYILHLLYPKEVKINRYEMICRHYEKVMRGECKFHREFFLGPEGFKRFCSCLAYLFKNYKTFSDIGEVFRFITSPEGKVFLGEHKLATPADQYAINVLEATYYIFQDNPLSEVYYYYYKFKDQFKRIQRKNTVANRELNKELRKKNSDTVGN